jgi:hypothetical protein
VPSTDSLVLVDCSVFFDYVFLNDCCSFLIFIKLLISLISIRNKMSSVSSDTDTMITTTSYINDNNNAAINTRLFDGVLVIEVCGLTKLDNGRSCTIHLCCGKFVTVGDVLRLRETVVGIAGYPEAAIKLVKIIDGLEGCTVAYIPRTHIKRQLIINQMNRFCIVTELYNDSKNTYKI